MRKQTIEESTQSDCNRDRTYLCRHTRGISSSSGEQLKKLKADGYPFFHIDSEFSEFSCTTRHTGGRQVP